MGDQNTKEESIILAALSTLTSSQLSSLSLSLSSTFHRHHHRLISLFSSPTLFTHTLNHLYSLSLPQKSLLISRHLLSFLHLLSPFFPSLSTLHHNTIRYRHLDSALLLLFFCDARQHDPKALQTDPINWHEVLKRYCFDTILRLSGFIVNPTEVLGAFIDIVVKCRRFVSTRGCGGRARNTKREVAASAAAVVGLPSVEVKRGGGVAVECVICKEQMGEGRDVCQLPCQHLFHWMCVLPWLRKRNTCPCCRFRLPTDDVYGEIERMWEAIVKLGRTVLDADQCT